jgi:autoinducer 2-degrading protein
MIVTCIYVHVKPEFIDKFIEASVMNCRESSKEEGNFCFDLSQQQDDPSRFLFYEAYVDEAAAAAHKNTPQYLRWRDTVVEMMASPRTGMRYNVIEPSSGLR